MRIEADTLFNEIEQVRDLLQKWMTRIEAGVPEDEIPAEEQNAAVWRYQLRGEVQLCAERLAALVDVLEE